MELAVSTKANKELRRKITLETYIYRGIRHSGMKLHYNVIHNSEMSILISLANRTNRIANTSSVLAIHTLSEYLHI